jgi:hypothetical protein
MALVAEVPGVEHVADVDVWSDEPGGCTNACVPATALVDVVSLDVAITEEGGP